MTDSHPRGGLGRLIAIGLVVAIGWLAADVFPVLRAERHLSIALNAATTEPMRALQSLQKAAAVENLSRRQKAHVHYLAREILEHLRGRSPLLKTVGPRAYDPAAPARPYVSARNEIVLTFGMPPGLWERGARFNVASVGRTLAEVRMNEDGTSGRADVPLEPGATVVADVDLVCQLGACGSVVEPIARGLTFVQSSRGPRLVLRAGAEVAELRDGDSLRLQVDRGTPIEVEVSDGLGVNDLQWRVDGVAHDPFDWREAAESKLKEAGLPPDLTAAASGAREIELKASNSFKIPTSATVQLFVREPRDPPIASARIEKGEVRDGAVIHVSEHALTLAVRVAKGELADDLAVWWDDRPQKTHVSGNEVSSLLLTDVEGPKMLVLKMRNAPALHCTVVFDWTPPVVTAVLDPGDVARDLEVRRPVHDVPIGSIVQFTISDPVGIDRELTGCSLDGIGLEELPEPESAPVSAPASGPPTGRAGWGMEAAKTWTKSYRCAQAGDAWVRLAGADIAGNRTTIHEFRIRSADPMAGRTITLNGRTLVCGTRFYTSEKVFEVRAEGGIDLEGMVFLMLDAERDNAQLGQAPLVRGERADARTAAIDLSFLRTSGRRVLAVVSRSGRELAKFDVVIDFAPPVLRVENLAPAPSQGDVPRYFASGGENVSLTLSDDVGIDVGSVSVVRGAEIAKFDPNGAEIALVVTLPAVLEEPVVLSVADYAKNHAELRFDVVSKEGPRSRPARTSGTVPQSRAGDEPGSSKPESGPSYGELAGNPKIEHPLLGTFLLVPVKASAEAPAFYIGEHEVSVKEWRAFAKDVQARADAQDLAVEAMRVLNRNVHVWSKGDDEPFSGSTSELAKAYSLWAGEIAKDYGVWRIPTAAQWKLAAGRATHPEASYPATAAHQDGRDLGSGTDGALFGRDPAAFLGAPKHLFQPGAYGIRAMAGGLYEWVVDARGRLQLIGGSAFSTKQACHLDAALRAPFEVSERERGLRLILLPKDSR